MQLFERTILCKQIIAPMLLRLLLKYEGVSKV